ncbi:uncharacterized protein LOC123038150 isoform X2 [Drosophila rhopaloa]|uniref:Peptidase aspartic putative domain-containing protein n=1 Tax=Drosophila rhopaloa TaxID=1041015 RepID=A0ABM5JGK0_DRORH|nr:uncharacterized protein LOC123038150 isoform X2 [Drosophila rhopaloa]
MAETFEELIAEQSALIDSVRRMLENFRKAGTNNSEAHMETRLESLANIRMEFRENHRKLVRSDDELVRNDYMEADLEGKFQEAYIDSVAQIRTDLNETKDRLLASTGINNLDFQDGNRNALPSRFIAPDQTMIDEVKLPTVKLPIFSGEFVDWPAFKEIFEARVHNSPRLTDLHRFHYLKDSLSGEAIKDIQHLTLIETNYHVAWQMLLNLYDNKRVLFQHYMQVLEQQPMVQSDDPVSLKGFLQTCRSCIKSLEKVGVNLFDQSHVIVYMVTKKLPAELRLDWEKSLATSQELPTFEELSAHLDGQYRTMLTSASGERTILSNKDRKGASGSSEKRRDVKSSFVARSEQKCAMCCKNGHSVQDCKVFESMHLTARREAVMKQRLCFNCLGNNHNSRRCKLKNNCSICADRHHTLIHLDRVRLTKEPNEQVQQVTSNAISGTSSTTGTSYEVLLPTALVLIQSAEGFTLQFRAFLDQGSQASFVSENVVQKLGLTRQKAYIKVNGLANAQVTEASSSVLLCFGSRFETQARYSVTAYVLPKVSKRMPNRRLSVEKWSQFEQFCLADPNYFVPQGVDILLGSDIYDELMLSEIHRGPDGWPIAQSTRLGFIISGKVKEPITKVSVHTVTVIKDESSAELEGLLRRFWEFEQLDEAAEVLSKEDLWCEEHFVNTHVRLPSGKYQVRLPFLSALDPQLVIGSSRQGALKRLCHLDKRLRNDANLKEVYSKTIKEYLELGQMEKVVTQVGQTEETGYPGGATHCYLPHHPVIKESSTTTKVRVVFDGSMKTSNGKSLNEILAIGPKLHMELPAILINWRVIRFAFLADVEKMYRCINIHKKDAQFQRILWKTDNTVQVEEYACCTVMFGTSCAPYLAIRVMQQLAEDEEHNYPLAANVLKRQMYVDDVLSGANSISDAKELQAQVRGMMRRGSFELRKWASNCPQLLEGIPLEHRETKEPLNFQGDETIRALGLYWKPNEDEFRFQINFDLPTGTPTKRKMLSTIARLFDPMGWLSPITVVGKRMVQALWKTKLSWDDHVPLELQKEWQKFIQELPNLSKIHIPRYIAWGMSKGTPQLHMFCDASGYAYGAAAYLRIPIGENAFHAELILAKCKRLYFGQIR